MLQNILFYPIPVLFLLLSLHELITELFLRRLLSAGEEAVATVVSVDHTIAFGLRAFFAAFEKKGKETGERTFGCDYIMTLRYLPVGRPELTLQTTARARMRILDGKRMPYFLAGDTVPIRYSRRFPKRLVIMLEPVMQQQRRPLKLLGWGLCTVLMAAILITMLVVL